MGGASDSPTNPEKGHADKRRIINVDNPSDATNLDINRHEYMTPGEP